MNMGNDAIGRITGHVDFTLKAIEGRGDAPIGAHRRRAGPEAGGRPAAERPCRDGDEAAATRKGEGEMLFDVAQGATFSESTMKTDDAVDRHDDGPDGSPTTMQNKTTTSMTMELVEK